MDRTEFEALRDLEGKMIVGDVRLVSTVHTRPVWAADDVPIEADAPGTELVLNTNYTPETGRFVINVCVRGVGPICRLCVNGAVHRGAGRSHKHAVVSGWCVGRGLPEAQRRDEFAGRTVVEAWQAFCQMARINHVGTLVCESFDLAKEIL